MGNETNSSSSTKNGETAAPQIDDDNDKVEKESSESSTEKQQPPMLKPFAIINSVAPQSPSSKAGLKPKDKIIRFGRINIGVAQGTDALLLVRDLVAASENERISLVIERNENEMKVIRLIPAKWNGAGLLGCHI